MSVWANLLAFDLVDPPCTIVPVRHIELEPAQLLCRSHLRR